MPPDAQFMQHSELLSVDEIISITSALVDLGIDEVRVTGGEPTVRKEFRDIMMRLSDLPVQKLGLTTNGFLLEGHLKFLQGTRLRNINISLDSLHEDKFKRMTRSPRFQEVKRSILKSAEMGFQVKVNTILFRGMNDDEILDFVTFSEQTGIEVRFLEYMNIGPQYEQTSKLFLSADDAMARIWKEKELLPVKVAVDSTSFNFKTPQGGRIGFIASETKPFCGSCSRLRLTAKGSLRACLMSEQGLNLRNVPPENYPQILANVLSMKPTGRITKIAQPMHEIGG
jgi:cyclic pyranopterin phosphate synthase